MALVAQLAKPAAEGEPADPERRALNPTDALPRSFRQPPYWRPTAPTAATFPFPTDYCEELARQAIMGWASYQDVPPPVIAVTSSIPTNISSSRNRVYAIVWHRRPVNNCFKLDRLHPNLILSTGATIEPTRVIGHPEQDHRAPPPLTFRHQRLPASVAYLWQEQRPAP